MIQKSNKIPTKRPGCHGPWQPTAKKSSWQRRRWQGGRQTWQKRQHDESFKRWVTNLTTRRHDYMDDLPEFFAIIYAKGPQKLPKVGKSIRLSLDYFVLLREEGYQIPHFIRQPNTQSMLNGKIDLIKPLPNQSNTAPTERRAQVVISYKGLQGPFRLVNTPLCDFDLCTISDELLTCLNSGHLQLLYDPTGLFLDYQGIVLRSLSPFRSIKGIQLYAPPICHGGNNLMYEDSNSKNLQISFMAMSGPSLSKLETYTKGLKKGQSIFVKYLFKKYAYNQEGTLQLDFEDTTQFIELTIKLISVNLNETAESIPTKTEDNAQPFITSFADYKRIVTQDTTSCVVSGTIHQVRTIGNNQRDCAYKVNPDETDEQLFKIFNFIKVQHWQVKSGCDEVLNPEIIDERTRVVPPYSHKVGLIPERAAICHVLGKNLDKFGVFPYVNLPTENWTITQPVQCFLPC